MDIESEFKTRISAVAAGRAFLRGQSLCRKLFAVFALILFFCPLRIYADRVPVLTREDAADSSLGGKIRNSSRMIGQIREGLRRHSAGITVSFAYGSDVFDELNAVIESWMEAAQEETDRPDEGDYIRYQLGGYTYRSTSENRDGRWFYRVRIAPSYYTFLSEEEEVTEAVRKVRRSMHFWPWTSREKKIRKLYDYMCRNVHYDKVHRKNPYYHKRSTAYGALVQGTATCQGYCTAMYRLLREEKIPCRIITGTAGDEELHAWLITELEGQWYLLDPTWDAGRETYRYLLAGSETFAGGETGEDSPVPHVPGDAFQTEAFRSEHPMAEADR